MTPDAFRQSYLSFFQERGHAHLPSDSLVPENDPTLLFTGAGMNQFKAEFMGKGSLSVTRATTSQKCLRMPDLENVGRTSSHHTFFEMLGNFSFGDYFKEEAIRWAWEFLGQLGLPADRLSVTVYKDDDEAAELWHDGLGVPTERIFRCDEDENFWPASAPSKGPNGICGPCSEIYFDYDPSAGAYPAEGPGEDGKRFVEIWNLVFTQFQRLDGGVLEPLPQRNIDTGMGFERVLRVLESLEQGEVLDSNFETSLFLPLVDAIHEHVGQSTRHGTPQGERVRRIADHVRAAVFCIGDGVRPSNEKQGYVVRKVLRRAMLDRHLLGADLRTPWLCELASVVTETMGAAYPDLREAAGLITSTVAAEEEKFAGAFLSGSQKLATLAEQARSAGQSRLGGREAFLLYDTFGLPLDLQKMLLDDEDLGVDEDGYREAMAEQRRRSRESSKISDSIFDEGPLAAVSGSLPETTFERDALQAQVNALAVVDDPDGDASDGSRPVLVVLDRTPFYTEGGGQAGDRGVIEGDGFRVEVDDVVGLRGISLHRGAVVEGEANPGPVTARVDTAARGATARNHTATHLLHAGLRQVLGEECTQAGSLVTPDRLRFDFRFPRAVTDDELREVEDLVNAWVLANADVSAAEMSRDAARERGAMALFGEKYGDTVRVVSVPHAAGPDSVELCGGTHVARAGDIGLVRIISESSVAAGVRRIEARSGLGALAHVRAETARLREAASLLKANPDQLVERLGAAQAEAKATRKELDDVRQALADAQLGSAARDVAGLKVLAAPLTGVPPKKLREVANGIMAKGTDVAFLAIAEADATHFLVAAGKAAQGRGLEARSLAQGLAERLGGKGGGNAAMAQGRGGPTNDLAAILDDVVEALASEAQGSA